MTTFLQWFAEVDKAFLHGINQKPAMKQRELFRFTQARNWIQSKRISILTDTTDGEGGNPDLTWWEFKGSVEDHVIGAVIAGQMDQDTREQVWRILYLINTIQTRGLFA